MLRRPRALISLLLASLLASLGGCATTPEPLQGEFSALSPSSATAADIGRRVRWGGRLLEVHPERERTCFEILSLPLSENARPKAGATPGRRFLACRAGFIDPAAFPEDRLLTVTGELAAFVNRTIGEYDYRYPIVEINAVHLWPQAYPHRAPYPVGVPWWYDPYPYWGPSPYWGPHR